MDWTEYYACEDVDKAWDIMYENIVSAADAHCPFKMFTRLAKLPPWLIPELVEYMKERDLSYKIAKSTGSLDDWIAAKKIRNLCNREIQKAKEKFILEQLEVNKNDVKKFGETLNSVYPSSKQTLRNNSDITLVANREEIPADQTPDYMNQFLCTVGQKLANSIPHTEHEHNIKTYPRQCRFELITLEETLEVIQSIAIYRLSALDKLPSRLVKDAFNTLCNQVHFLFNLSITTGISQQMEKSKYSSDTERW